MLNNTETHAEKIRNFSINNTETYVEQYWNE